jgi:hypothetical protein
MAGTRLVAKRHHYSLTHFADFLLIILLIGFLWMAFASVNIVFKDQLLELKQQ